MSVSTDQFRMILEKADRFDEIASVISQRNRAKKEIHCSFCGKHQYSVVKIVAGTGAYICNECVNLCSEIIHDEEYCMFVDGYGI